MEHCDPAEQHSIRLARAVFNLQSRLLDLPQCSDLQLLAAGSLLSQRGYDDVVTERSLSTRCGFPRCSNPIPASRIRKGRFRISRREHRVYDTRDANRFCSDACCVSSNAFAATLDSADDCTAGPALSRIAHILSLFHDAPPEAQPLQKDGLSAAPTQPSAKPSVEVATLGLSNLSIHEKTEPCGKISSDRWLGPADAIEGYVPKRDRNQGSAERSLRNRSDSIPDDHKLDADKTRSSNSEDGSEGKVQVKELKSSLRKPGNGGGRRGGVRWADEEQKNNAGVKESLCRVDGIDEESELRLASAEACVSALMQASEAVASGEYEVEDAVNDAGLLIMPPSHNDAVETDSEDEALIFERCRLKWPRKPVLLDTDEFDVEDSWHDAPPEGFKLTLSTFAVMWKAMFGWMTCSSLAYIYGGSANSEHRFLLVNGREYPPKVTLNDGRSLEIKKTLANCIARVLPQVVSKLRLPMPVSTIESAMVHLLETMSFTEAVPPFKTNEWSIIVILFLDALSVSQIPTLYPHLESRTVLLNEGIEAAQMRRDEYETLKDLVIPLGRVHQFSVQSGGL